MSFALTPASPFAFGVGTVPSSWMNFVRNALPDCVDGIGGGTYNLLSSATLTFPAGGGNIVIGAPLTYTQADIPTGGVLTVEGQIDIENEGFIDVKFGGAITVESGGDIELKSGATLYVDLGGTILAETGSFVFLSGGTYVVDGGVGGGDGTIYVGYVSAGVGHLLYYSGSDETFQTGTALVMQSGSTATFENAVTFTGSTSSATWDTNATLFMGSSAGTATFNNAVTAANVTTLIQTGLLTFSGVNARQALRYGKIAGWDASSTWDPSQFDVIPLEGGSGSWTWRMKAPQGNICAKVRFVVDYATGATDAIVVVDDNTGDALFTFTPGVSSGPNSVEMHFEPVSTGSGPKWVVDFKATGGLVS